MFACASQDFGTIKSKYAEEASLYCEKVQGQDWSAQSTLHAKAIYGGVQCITKYITKYCFFIKIDTSGYISNEHIQYIFLFLNEMFLIGSLVSQTDSDRVYNSLADQAT